MLWALVAILALFGVYSVVVVMENRRVREERRALFASRPRVDRHEWFREQFACAVPDEETCVKALAPIATAIGCELTQLRARDAFLGELAFKGTRWLGLDGDDPVEDYLEYELDLAVGKQVAEKVQSQAEGLRTLEDFARAIGQASSH